MTMEIERRYAAVPPEMLDYLRANPTPPADAGSKVEFHVHHHYAPADPIPPGHIVRQGPEKSLAEKVVPWLWISLFACIVLTLCAAVLATVLLVVVAVLAAVILLGLVVAYIINSQTGAIEARGKAAVAAAKAEAEAMLRDGKGRKRR